jgi:hypothetical protein
MIINPYFILEDDKIVSYNSKIKFLDTYENLYFKIDKKYSKWITDKSDPLLISLLIPAMKNRENIEVQGTISKKLYNNLDNIQDLLIAVMPGLSKVKVEADIIEDKDIRHKAVLSGFSAGVDAFTTFEDYYLNPKSKIKITHFLFNNLTYGSHRIYRKIDNINKIKQKYNFPLFQTWSNLHSFYKKGHKIGFEQTHTMRNAAIPHFLGGMPNLFLYSSTFHKDLIQPIRSHDLAIIDDLLLPLLSSNTVQCMSVGSEYTRLDKTLKISKLEDAYRHLDTCIGKQTRKFINCGTCRKCTRALLTFELVNKKNNFKNIFNLEAWNSVRENYIKDLPNRTQLNDNELYNYILKNYKEML